MQNEHPLRAYRRQMQRTLESVADEAETTKETLSRIERGLRSPSFALAIRLSRITSIPVENFAAVSNAEHVA